MTDPKSANVPAPKPAPKPQEQPAENPQQEPSPQAQPEGKPEPTYEPINNESEQEQPGNGEHAVMSEAEKFEPELKAENIGEAGGIANTTLFGVRDTPRGKETFMVSLTARGTCSRQALQNLFDGLQYVKSRKLGLTLYDPLKKPLGTAPTLSPVPGQAPALGQPPAPGQPPTPPPPTQTAPGGVIEADRVEVTPKADGKSEVGFFAGTHRFPDVKTVRSTTDLAKLMAKTGAWQPSHFAAAQSYNLKCKVTWKPGRPNSKGNPYMDIVDVDPA